MRLLPIACAAAFSILLAGCNSEPEETPALEDAIPLDNPSDGQEAGGTDEAQQSGTAVSGTETGNTTQNASDDAQSSSTMESGSNEDGGRAPDPSRTKLVPAD
ncbi:hypothetical protein [uncultured Erythrobacter sp.]|uniref:hypothetical protein n=1 Tax=uncultured Erythrobacter sp. TaxID=263913 RepID=UPI00262C7030|nr:hypothetical protein [uncultured Erythrobacter sp.]